MEEIDSLAEEPPPKNFITLDNLALFLQKNISERFSLNKNRYDSSISIILSSERKYEAFRVYTDKEVADNTKFLEKNGHKRCAKYLKYSLKQMGFTSFHNPYVSYINKRIKDSFSDT